MADTVNVIIISLGSLDLSILAAKILLYHHFIVGFCLEKCGDIFRSRALSEIGILTLSSLFENPHLLGHFLFADCDLIL